MTEKYYYSGSLAGLLELFKDVPQKEAFNEGEKHFEITVKDVSPPVTEPVGEPQEDEQKDLPFAKEEVSPAQKAANDLAAKQSKDGNKEQSSGDPIADADKNPDGSMSTEPAVSANKAPVSAPKKGGN